MPNIERILEQLLAADLTTVVIVGLIVIIVLGLVVVICLLVLLWKVVKPFLKGLEIWAENEERKAKLELKRDEDREKLRATVQVQGKEILELKDDKGNQEAKIRLYANQLNQLEKDHGNTAAALKQEREDRRRESEEKQKAIDGMTAEIAVLRKQLFSVETELAQARKDLDLRNRENQELIEMNKRLTTERQADKEATEKRISELEALSAKLAGQLEETIKQRDDAIVDRATKEDRIKLLEQQNEETQARLGKIEIKTGPLSLSPASKSPA